MACVRCGGTVAPDGRCWDCGAAQPAYRAHLETAVPGAAGVTDRGRRRDVNADAMALVTAGPWTIGVVCDGVSMAPRADRAARVAADTAAAVLAARLPAGVLPETALDEAAARAGRAVAALATSVRSAPACTYVAGVHQAGVHQAGVHQAGVHPAGAAAPGAFWTSWVGDSRAYWLPDDGPGVLLTEDDTGELDALAAWLGADAGPPEPRCRGLRPSGPGRLLLCTDGLWRYLPDPGALRAAMPGGEAADDARALVGRALDAGGDDNVTAMVVRAGPPPRDGASRTPCSARRSP
ncbi:PP2C family serine/threonine-protein phosphatase [Actinomadura sp. WMMB 499]|uniref:PP2C family protein-serine/threonine phosphatase n=1 Tax=Actinomadura sp. WMMB 499 TaxID=1219491 RepID=UPI00124588DF|nr:protein phosphatase 2C domain-containing protein [Actinomadura sp. WMMB 499]QFG20615.1 protein serine/threonine phosphatase 2C family protein [Actinomadura sp. WMMB 499]